GASVVFAEMSVPPGRGAPAWPRARRAVAGATEAAAVAAAVSDKNRRRESWRGERGPAAIVSSPARGARGSGRTPPRTGPARGGAGSAASGAGDGVPGEDEHTRGAFGAATGPASRVARPVRRLGSALPRGSGKLAERTAALAWAGARHQPMAYAGMIVAT